MLVATSWPHRRTFCESDDKYRLYLDVFIHISIADATLRPSDANYRRKQDGTHFLRTGEHIVKWCSLLYERPLWNSSELGVMKSYFGTFAYIPERLLHLTKCWAEEIFWQEVWSSALFILGDFEMSDYAPMVHFMYLFLHIHGSF